MANKYLDDNGLLYFWQQIKAKLAQKVDAVSGKGLSTNDYTSDEKTKLAGIAAGAEVNVNADWDASTGDAAILHKPAIPTKTSDLTNDSGFITSADVPEGATASTTVPYMDGTASVGSELAFARGDHRHPTDTSRAPLASPALTGTPTAPTATAGTNNTQIATTGFVQGELSGYAKKSDIANAYVYKGSVATYSALPSSGLTAGDVYNVESDGQNYAWTGSAWDALGGSFSITAITNAEIDAIMAA